MTTRRAFVLAVALALPATGAAAPASAATAARAPSIAATDPVGTVRAAERQIRAAFKAGGKRADLEKVAAGCIDYEELARRSVGPRWAGLPAADRLAVVKAQRALFEETYLSGLFRPDPHFAFAVLGSKVTGTEADVKVVIQSGGRQAPADLRLFRGRDGRFRIFDATVNGVAVLAGYQEQFGQLLDLGGVPKLVSTLEAQRKALAQMRARPAPQGSR